jgi:NADH-quinone oxidoreductase subunit L
VIAWLAIAGVPPFSGFFAKDGVLEKTFEHSDYGLWVVGLLAAVLTGAYMTRQVFLTFFGNERFRAVPDESHGAEVPRDEVAADQPAHGTIGMRSPTVAYGEPPQPPVVHHDPHEGSGVMVGPVVLLAGLAVVGGLLNVPVKGMEYLDEWLEPVFRDAGHIPTPSFVGGVGLSLLAVAVGLVGIVVAYALYRRGLPSPDRDPFGERLGVLGRVFGHAYYYDESISRAVDSPVRGFAGWLAQGFDAGIVDGAVNGLGKLVRNTGEGFRKLQTGLVRNYVLGVVVGTAALLVYLLVWAAR